MWNDASRARLTDHLPRPPLVDSDTFTLEARDEGEAKVRLRGIDTPERGDASYDEATAALQAMIQDQPVTLHFEAPKRRDNFGSLLARVDARGRHVGAALLQAGHAKEWRGTERQVRQ